MIGRMIQAQQRSCYAVFLFNTLGGGALTFPLSTIAVSVWNAGPLAPCDVECTSVLFRC